MIRTISLLSVAVFAAGISGAAATTITNIDGRVYKMTVEQDSGTRNIEIAPNERLENLCESRCLVTLEGDSEAYELEVTDAVQIEGGQLYFEDAPQNDQQGGTSQ